MLEVVPGADLGVNTQQAIPCPGEIPLLPQPTCLGHVDVLVRKAEEEAVNHVT